MQTEVAFGRATTSHAALDRHKPPSIGSPGRSAASNESSPHRRSGTAPHASFADAAREGGGGGGGAGGDARDSPEELVKLADEMEDLAERLAQVERVTQMLTPEYTHSLQKKLHSSFTSIEDR